MLTIESVALSHVGKVRKHNEDAIHIDDEGGLWLVADGMGGHASGEVASNIAISSIPKKIEEKMSLTDAIACAHQNILLQGQENSEQTGMGTTIVAAKLTTNGFYIAWIGDSRIYCIDRKVIQLTVDHTFVQDMVYREILTPEEAQKHQNSNLINRSLGMENGRFKVDSKRVLPVRDGYLLLCSDGVSDYLSITELSNMVDKRKSLQSIADVIETAILSSEAGDNFSFVIVKYQLSFWVKLINMFKVMSK